MILSTFQPFNENMMRPCPLLDNPEKLKAMAERSGALIYAIFLESSIDEIHLLWITAPSNIFFIQTLL